MENKIITLNSSVMQLPILKHFNEGEISKKVDSFRKGEKNLFWFLKLAVFGGIGFFTVKYVLPPVFQAVGQVLAVAATGILIVALIIMAPLIIKGIRALTKFLHKALIKHDPFSQLEEEGKKMLANRQTFRESKSKISALQRDMELEATNSEKEATEGQKRILTIQGKAEKLKSELDSMVQERGIDAKGDDAYVDKSAELVKILSESQRVSHKLNQSKDYVQKYGSRALIMKKFVQKLTMVEANMDIKIADFDATIEMLKKDYEFSRKSRAATESAKSAMLFTKGWELEYALDIVTTTIAEDIAITAGNIKDIDSLSKYNVDSDELYENLNALADNIKVGKEPIPMAKNYSNPDYKLTSSDKQKAGGLEDIFN